MAASDVKQLQNLLLWARKERIVLSSVQLGSLTVTIERDFGLTPPAATPVPTERKPSIYEQYGGALLNAMEQPADKNEPTVEDDE